MILFFDEMYLQKGEEFVGSELVGADEDGKWYKGIVSFMIVGLTQNIPYIFKALPETKISGEWLMEELWKWIPSPWCCLCQLT